MKTKKHVLAAGLGLTLISALALSVWRISYMKEYYDPYKFEYDFEADPTLSAFGWTLFAIVILIAALSFFTRKVKVRELPASSGQMSVFSNAFCGVLFIISAIVTLIYRPLQLIGASGESSAFYTVTLLLSVFLMGVCGAYFLINASVRLNTWRSKKHLSVALPFWGIIFLCTSYFNNDYLYSDPNRILANITVISFMILLLLESRSAVGRPQNVLRYFFSLTTVFFITVYFIPTVLLTAFWEMKPTLMFFLEICEAGIFFYALSTAVNYITSVGKSEA